MYSQVVFYITMVRWEIMDAFSVRDIRKLCANFIVVDLKL